MVLFIFSVYYIIVIELECKIIVNRCKLVWLLVYEVVILDFNKYFIIVK